MAAKFWIVLGMVATALVLPPHLARAEVATDDTLLSLAYDAINARELPCLSSDDERKAFKKFFWETQHGHRSNFIPEKEEATFWSLINPLFEPLKHDRDLDDKLLSDPAYAEFWGKERTVKAEWIMWLCTNPKALGTVRSRGIEIVGARIEGKVDLEWVNLPFPLRTFRCVFTDDIILNRAKLASLQLQSTYIKGLDAEGLTVNGDLVFTDGFRAVKPVWLRNVTIKGPLNCDNGQFIAPSPPKPVNGHSDNPNPHPALNLEGAKIGAVFMRAAKTGTGDVYPPFKAEGEVRLSAAVISGNVDCEGGEFINPGEVALNLVDAKTDSIRLANVSANGEVRMRYAAIGGTLDCDRGCFIMPDGNGTALDLQGAKTRSILFQDSFALGKVWLYRVTIDGNLECDRAQFRNGSGDALNLDYAKTGTVILKNFFALGTVSLQHATIDGSFECTEKAVFYPPSPPKFLFMPPFPAKVSTAAIDAQEASINGHVRMFDIDVNGPVYFSHSQIEHDLWLEEIRWGHTASLDLTSAKAKALLNEKESWPAEHALVLEGFTFEELRTVQEGQLDADIQNRWIMLCRPSKSPAEGQKQPAFNPQPYEQMAAVMRHMGLQEEAENILIEKSNVTGPDVLQNDYQEVNRFLSDPISDLNPIANLRHLIIVSKSAWDLFWYYGFGRVIGYGYHPGMAFVLSLIVIVIGTVLFQIGYDTGIVVPTDDDVSHGEIKNYPKFNAFIYSLETFVPLVKLGVGDHWRPNAHGGAQPRFSRFPVFKVLPCRWGGLLRVYFCLHIMLGWVLTTLWVGGFTGFIKT